MAGNRGHAPEDEAKKTGSQAEIHLANPLIKGGKERSQA